MKLIPFILSEFENFRLNHIVKFDTNWRIRERASTLLLLAQGFSCVKVAEKMGLSRPTVESTRKNWFSDKFKSLPDLPRSGAPRKIKPDEAKQILKLVDEKPLSATDVLKIHLKNEGTAVHVATVRALLKKEGRSWKMTRHSLKNVRDEQAFQQARQEIDVLNVRAESGEIVLGYLDEAGFSCVHPNRRAWTKIGSQHLISAIRGQRLNVLAALMSSGELEDFMFSGPMSSKIFTDFVDEIADKYDKEIVFIIDNASFHKSKAVAEWVKNSKPKNVTLKFLPPYSPELNRIEKFWHTVKHRWMEVKCRTFAELREDVSDIFNNFGGKFKFAFNAK
jgi:transposase